MKNEMNLTPETNDPLDELLRGADEYIPDNGFTARVLTALPVRRSHSWRRLVVFSVAMLVGGALAVWQWPAVMAILNPLTNFSQTFQWRTLIAVVPLLAVAASLAWVGFAMIREEE